MSLTANYFNFCDRFNESELAVIGLSVYKGELPSAPEAKALFNALPQLQRESVKDVVDHLDQLDLVESAGGSYWSSSKCVARYFHFPIAFHILANHRDWAEAYSQIKISQSPTAKFVWQFATALFNDDSSMVYKLRNYPKWPYSGAAAYCHAMVCEPEFSNVIMSLPSGEFRKVLDLELETHIRENNRFESADYLRALLKRYNSMHPLPDYEELCDSITAFLFFQNAEKPEWDYTVKTYWSCAVEAIRDLYRRDIESASGNFSQALKLWNLKGRDKNIFPYPLLNYYLIIFYALCEKSVGKKKVEIFLKKPYLEDSLEDAPAKMLGKYLVLNQNAAGRESSILDFVRSCYFSPYSMIMGSILCNFLEYSVKDVIDSPEMFNLVPESALLRYESSFFNPDCTDAAELERRLGGAPLLGGFYRKPQWEQILEDLLGENKDILLSKDRRLIYEIYSNGRMSVREQKLSKTGGWTSGQMVPLYNLRLRDYMDDYDKKVYHKYYSAGCSFVVKDILPCLVGCDRVFYSDGYDRTPVTIVEDKVYLTIDHTTKGFRVRTNLNGVPKDGNPLVVKEDNYRYTVYSLSAQEYAVLSKLVGIGTFPLEAEPALRKFCEQFRGKIEIHSSLIDGGSTLERVGADSREILRLKPYPDGMFMFEAGVRPLEGGSLFVSPGKGSATVYDSRDGKRFQIVRDIMAERRRHDALVDFLVNIVPGFDTEEDSMPDLTGQEVLELMDFVSDKTDDYVLEWPEGQSLKIRGRASSNSISASLVSKEKWFEVEGDVTIDKDEVISLAELLSLFAQSGGSRFVRLSDGDFVALSESLRKHLKKLESVSQSKGRIPVYQVGVIADLVHSKDTFIKADGAFNKLEKKVDEASRKEFPVPSDLDAELRPYQIEGYEWMMRLFEWGAGACLADDMGLGKTVQSIAAMLSVKGPSLVVAPASVILNWAAELQKFAPCLHVSVMNDASDRTDIINGAGKNDVVICSYGLLIREEECLASKKWELVCLDEAHTIKNRETKMSAAAMKLQSRCRLALTGTPVQNNLAEMWNMFQFINPGLLGSYDAFSERYITGQHSKDNVKKLKNIIRPFILRRKKTDVIDDLPDKTDIMRRVVLSDSEATVYEAMRARASRELESAERVDINALAEITRLRQAACSISLVQKDWPGENTKITAAVDIIRQVLDSGSRILVFSQFTSFLTMVKDALGKGADDVMYLDGSTPVRKRAKMVDDFQSGKGKVFFISLKAGGLGLNLTGANYVLHLDPWWNPAIEQQATDRAHRIGQTMNVTVYHLISANTIEDKMLRLHKVKKDLADSILSGTCVAGTITLKELRELCM